MNDSLHELQTKNNIFDDIDYCSKVNTMTIEMFVKHVKLH